MEGKIVMHILIYIPLKIKKVLIKISTPKKRRKKLKNYSLNKMSLSLSINKILILKNL